MRKRIYISIVLLGLMLVMWSTRNVWESWIYGGFTLFFSVVAILIGALIFLENRNPSKTITWLMVLAFNPVIGFIFYMLFGQSYRKRRMFAKKALQDSKHYYENGVKQPSENAYELLGRPDSQLFRLAQNQGKSFISFHTDTKVLTDGEETFRKIIEA